MENKKTVIYRGGLSKLQQDKSGPTVRSPIIAKTTKAQNLDLDKELGRPEAKRPDRHGSTFKAYLENNSLITSDSDESSVSEEAFVKMPTIVKKPLQVKQNTRNSHSSMSKSLLFKSSFGGSHMHHSIINISIVNKTPRKDKESKAAKKLRKEMKDVKKLVVFYSQAFALNVTT